MPDGRDGVRRNRRPRDGVVFDAGNRAAGDGRRRSGSVRQFAAPDGVRAFALGRSDVREDRSPVAGDRAVAPANRLRCPRSGIAGLCVDGDRRDARGRRGCACHPDPGRHRHSRVGVCQASNSRRRGVAQGGSARGLRLCTRHALRRDERPSGPARLPGLERAESQPRPRPGQRKRVSRDGQLIRQRRPRGRQVESRRRWRARPVRTPEGQEAEVVLGLPACLHAVSALSLERIASACDVPQRGPLRCLVAPPVHVRRRVRTREEPERRRARRSAADAFRTPRGRAAPSRRLVTSRQVLGDRVRLGQQPAEAARRSHGPRRPLDG